MAQKLSSTMIKTLVYARDIQVTSRQREYGPYFSMKKDSYQTVGSEVPITEANDSTILALVKRGFLESFLVAHKEGWKMLLVSITDAGLKAVQPHIEERALAYTPNSYLKPEELTVGTIMKNYLHMSAEAYRIERGFKKTASRSNWREALRAEADLYNEIMSR